MKTIFKILRVLLILAFIGAFVILTINQMSIKEHQVVAESTSGKNVKYIGEELSFFADYYKYSDADGMEYWISSVTNKLEYIYNPAAQNITSSVSQSKAEDIAYDTAKYYNAEFFKSDSIIETKSDSYYEFYIFQLDESGYKNGKFIAVTIKGSEVASVAMHTDYNSAYPELGLCIGEKDAIDKTYAATLDSEFALYSEDNHLINTGFYKSDNQWIWEVKLYKISESDITNQTQPVNPDHFFIARVDAATGEVLTFEWMQNATDYCPLDGTIF